MYGRSDAENFSSVCLMVREKLGDRQTDRRTDRHGDNITSFSDEKSAKTCKLKQKPVSLRKKLKGTKKTNEITKFFINSFL